MNRDAFKEVARQAVETLTVAAEQRLAIQLPRRYVLGWLGGPVIEPGDDVAESLTAKVFVSEEEIYPCVDLFLDDRLPDGRLLVLSYRANYKPCRYGEHYTYAGLGHDAGRVGPFKLGCGGIVEKLRAHSAPPQE
jgi:hypothetical protein